MSEIALASPKPKVSFQFDFFFVCPGCSELQSDFRSRRLGIDMGDQNKRTSFADNTFVQIIVCRQGTSLTF